jgi:hypothetical protein
MIQQNSTYLEAGYPDRQLSGLAWLFGLICREFYKTNLPCNYRTGSNTVQWYGFSRTSNQAWCKG